jgi:hypothetical protein
MRQEGKMPRPDTKDIKLEKTHVKEIDSDRQSMAIKPLEKKKKRGRTSVVTKLELVQFDDVMADE